MVARVRRAARLAALAGLLVSAPAAVAAEEEAVFTPLAAYSFDGVEAPPTGPDTFHVWEKARGTVERSPHFRWSGGWSVEIRDEPGNGDFPELQGYFELRDEGRLFAHFALMVADPRETFNVALAGPAWFRLAPDGMAFWLENREEGLVHVSDSIPKRLLRLEAFTWYVVDVLYDIDRGSYDLAIYREHDREPLVALSGQPNAVNAPGSRVDKFSFIGDRGSDVSRVVYYVDDVVIGADRVLEPPPFVAPGRRRLFVETHGAHVGIGRRQFLCLPVIDGDDLGVSAASLAPGDLGMFRHGPSRAPETVEESPLAAVARQWGTACGRLGRNDFEGARSSLAAARDALSEAPILELTELLIRGRDGGEIEGLLEALSRLERELGADPRLAVARSMALGSVDRWDEAIGVLEPHFAASAEPNGSAAQVLDRLVVDQLYYALVRARRYDEAFGLIESRRTRDPARWLERTGDLHLLSGEPAAALESYRQARAAGHEDSSILLREADAAYLLGDAEEERRLRESIYGSLSESR